MKCILTNSMENDFTKTFKFDMQVKRTFIVTVIILSYIYKKISMNFLCFVYIECAIFILKVKTILSEIIFTSLSFMVFAFF